MLNMHSSGIFRDNYFYKENDAKAILKLNQNTIISLFLKFELVNYFFIRNMGAYSAHVLYCKDTLT